jgi:hypothetical protein
MRRREYEAAALSTLAALNETSIPFGVTFVKVGGPIRSWTVKVTFSGQNTRYFFERGHQWLVYGDGVGDQHLIGAIPNPEVGGLAAAVLEGYVDLLRSVYRPLTFIEKAIAPQELASEEAAEIHDWLLKLTHQLDVLRNGPDKAVAAYAGLLYDKQADLIRQAEEESGD